MVQLGGRPQDAVIVCTSTRHRAFENDERKRGKKRVKYKSRRRGAAEETHSLMEEREFPAVSPPADHLTL